MAVQEKVYSRVVLGNVDSTSEKMVRNKMYESQRN